MPIEKILRCCGDIKLCIEGLNTAEAGWPEVSFKITNSKGWHNKDLEAAVYETLVNDLASLRSVIAEEDSSFPVDRLRVHHRETDLPIYIDPTGMGPLPDNFPDQFMDRIASHVRQVVMKTQRELLTRGGSDDIDAELGVIVRRFLKETELELNPIGLALFLHDQRGVPQSEIITNASEFLLQRGALEAGADNIARLVSLVPEFLDAEYRIGMQGHAQAH